MNKKRSHIIAMACFIAVIFLICGWKIYVYLTPISTLDIILDSGKSDELSSIFYYAYRQADLYEYIETYQKKHSEIPDDIKNFLDDNPQYSRFSNNSLEVSYIIYPENYGNPDAVFISESQNKHKNIFSLWIRGIKPRIQTMGDGKTYLFKGFNFYVSNQEDE
jgi:hypothetical protein